VASGSGAGLELGEFDVADWGGDIVTLRATVDGRYLSARDDGGLVADAEGPNGWVVHETFAVTWLSESGEDGTRVLLRSTASGRYLGISGDTGELSACALTATEAEPLSWDVVADGTELAVAAARAAEVAVVVVGNHPLINGREAQDRVTLALPPAQERLIRAVHAANPRTVVVVVSSYPYAVTWAQEHVPAIVWTCHGGQEAGNALADVLLGEHAPTGRLAQTWYRWDADLADIGEYDIIKARRTYLYFEGEALYPFGHGLSYTSFGYSGLRLNGSAQAVAAGETVRVSVDVANTGPRAGEEVVQLYVRAKPRPGLRQGVGVGRLSVDRPRRQLVGFTRVALEAGARCVVELPLPTTALACWDVETQQMVVGAGDYEVMVGSSSADIRQTAILTVAGPEPGPRRLMGREVAAADFDDYAAVTLVDATRECGDAVAPTAGGGWILFRDAELDLTGPACIRLQVSRAQPGRTGVEVWRTSPGSAGPGDGVRIGRVTVESTGDGYVWAEASAALAAAPADLPGFADLYLVFTGELRLRSFQIDALSGAGSC
jgi:beta-glucosidase